MEPVDEGPISHGSSGGLDGTRCQADVDRVARPRSHDELIELVAGAQGPIRMVGAGHSFTALVPTPGTVLSLDHLEPDPSAAVDGDVDRAVDRARLRVFGLVADAESSHAAVERRAPDAATFGGGDHITGGGFTENIPRVLPDGLGAVLKAGSWDVPAIFPFLRQRGGLSDAEMYRTFNNGLCMVVIVPADQAAAAAARVGGAVVGHVRSDPDGRAVVA